jgi:hypothetical protein
MAEIFGSLRDDATYGEKVVLKKLKYNLPRDFSVYVECPLHSRRMQRFPDFIVVTNYAAIVLEVKDWVQIVQADRYNVTVRMRSGQEMRHRNPVSTTRGYALALQENLKSIPELLDNHHRLDVPWGYGVIFPNLRGAVLTQLRHALGENFILGEPDLGPNIILNKIKQTIPEGFGTALSGEQLRLIRAVINPTVLIESPDQPAIILDEVQERLVVAPVKVELEEQPEQQTDMQMALVDEVEQPPTDQLPPAEESLIGKLSVRLVRGVAGSGKSLVLIQRAKYLASQFPDWSILVVTYNTGLAGRLAQDLKGFNNIRAVNFHKLCRELIISFRNWKLQDKLYKWLADLEGFEGIFGELSRKYIKEEIEWIKENGITDLSEYLTILRRGRGKEIRVTKEQRAQIFQIVQAYQTHLKENNSFDWNDVPWIVHAGMEQGHVKAHQYDAILIDEAQDFAPGWIRVLANLAKESKSSMFIADDPTQSLYRYYSWKEKGVQVVGRTRWLRIPYRNTKQIYEAAFSIIKSNKNIHDQLMAEGESLNPDIKNPWMRSGQRPLLSQFKTMEEDLNYIQSRVQGLIQEGVSSSQIAVLSARKKYINTIKNALHNDEIIVDTFYQFKGLEYQYVFLPGVQELFRTEMDQDEISSKLRLVYMGMTRAREYLFINYRGPLPTPLNALLDYCDHIT